MSLVTITPVSVCTCFLNWKHTDFEPELGDRRICCLTLFTWRPWAHSFLSKIIFSVILLPRQPDRVPQLGDAAPAVAAGGYWGPAAGPRLGPGKLHRDPVSASACSGSLISGPALGTLTEPTPPAPTTVSCQRSLAARGSLGGRTLVCTHTSSGWLPRAIFP